MVKAIIFDFAGVLAADGYWRWILDHFPDPVHHQFFHDISYLVDEGRITESEFLGRISEKCGTAPEQIRSEIHARMIVDPEMAPLIKQLKSRFKIGLLSNFIYEWLDAILHQHQLYPLFDAAVISSKHKILKPNPESFELVCSMLGVKQEESLLIDDRKLNTDGAVKQGLDAILFTSRPQLEREMRERGFID